MFFAKSAYSILVQYHAGTQVSKQVTVNWSLSWWLTG